MAMDRKFLSRYMDTVGDGSGTKNATGNYSGGGLGATDFSIIAGASEFIEIDELVISIEDGTGGFTNDTYGALSALSTGIVIAVRDSSDNTFFTITDVNTPVKTNGHLSELCYDTVFSQIGTPTNDQFLARLDFRRQYGHPILLDPTEKFVVTLNDDLSGLNAHYFKVKGQIFAGRDLRRLSAITAS